MSDQNIIECLGDATPSDVKLLCLRITDLRGRVARLNNLVDMLYHLKRRSQRELPLIYRRFLERERLSEVTDKKAEQNINALVEKSKTADLL